MHNYIQQDKNRTIVLLLFILAIQLYCLFIIAKGPVIGLLLTKSQDQSWYIHHVKEDSWGAYKKLNPDMEVLEIDGVKLSKNAPSPFKISQAESLTILHEGNAMTLTVTYDGLAEQKIKHLIMPVIYALLTTALSIFLLRQSLSKSKPYLIFHLQSTALAYSSAGAAGRGDYFSNIIVSLAILLSLVTCIFYCNFFFRTLNTTLQKKLGVICVITGILLVGNNIVSFFIKNFLDVQITFELFVFMILSIILFITIICANKDEKKQFAKPLFFIFCLGIGPFILFYGVPTLLNNDPVIPVDITPLFLLIVPICLIYLELAERFINLQYAFDRMLSHLQLVIPFSLVLSYILLLLQDIRSFNIYSLYFLVTIIASILFLTFKEWLELKDARYMTTLKDYNFGDFYRFIKSSGKNTNFHNLIENIKNELSFMLKLNSIKIVENGEGEPSLYIDTKKTRVIRKDLIYKNEENYVLVLHEAVDSKLLAIVNPPFNKIASESLKILELFLYYVQSIIDNSLKMDDLLVQLTQLDGLDSPRWYGKLWIASSERERIRLSTEIHDTVLQDLIRINRRIEESIDEMNDSKGKELFSHLREEVLDIMDATRDICEYLYPPFIEQLGFNESVEELLGKFKIRCNFLIRDNIDRLEGVSLQQSTTIYRIIQELLSNANKHSQADAVNITLKLRAQQVFIEYIDDGIGLGSNIQLAEIQSIGLVGIQERIKYYKGTFEILQNYPQGTIIKITMKIGESLENNGIR